MFQYFNIFVSCLHIFTQAFTSNYSQAGPTDVTQPLELHPCDHLPQLLDLFQGNLSVVQRSGLRNGWMLKRLKNLEGSHSTNIIRHPPIWLKTTAKHFSMRWKVWAQVKACCLHGNPWEIHGKSMEYVGTFWHQKCCFASLTAADSPARFCSPLAIRSCLKWHNDSATQHLTCSGEKMLGGLTPSIWTQGRLSPAHVCKTLLHWHELLLFRLIKHIYIKIFAHRVAARLCISLATRVTFQLSTSWRSKISKLQVLHLAQKIRLALGTGFIEVSPFLDGIPRWESAGHCSEHQATPLKQETRNCQKCCDKISVVTLFLESSK